MADTYSIAAPHYQVGPVEHDGDETYRRVKITSGVTVLEKRLHSVDEVVEALHANGHPNVTAANLAWEEGTNSTTWQ